MQVDGRSSAHWCECVAYGSLAMAACWVLFHYYSNCTPWHMLRVQRNNYLCSTACIVRWFTAYSSYIYNTDDVLRVWESCKVGALSWWILCLKCLNTSSKDGLVVGHGTERELTVYHFFRPNFKCMYVILFVYCQYPNGSGLDALWVYRYNLKPMVQQGAKWPQTQTRKTPIIMSLATAKIPISIQGPSIRSA